MDKPTDKLRKILIATGLYPPDIGGPATYSKLLMDELPRHGFAIKVLSFSECRRYPKLIRHIVYLVKILRRASAVDIIYAQDPVSVGLPVAIANLILRKRFVLKIVGDYAWEQSVQRFGVKDLLDDFITKKYGFRVTFLRKIQKFTAVRADKIIVPSNYLKKIVLAWGIDDNKIEVVYNSFDIPSLAIQEQDTEQRVNLTKLVLVSVGRLVPWKGFDALIDIMPDVIRQVSGAKLFIIGSGPDEAKLKSQINDNLLDGNVFLLGQLSRNELARYIKDADIFVLNTGYEGLSHQILEVMALGVPVITTNIGGNPELIEDGKSGLLVEYNNKSEIKNAILNLYNNHQLKEALIKNAKEKVKDFNKTKMIEHLIRVLQS